MRPSRGMALTSLALRERTLTPPTARKTRFTTRRDHIRFCDRKLGKAGENTETYSIVYSLFQPALPEKTIIALNQDTVACK